MSVHEPPRFTPGQILEAAHRAEGDGRLDIARQFYMHLVTNFPGLPEADAAARGLDRLKQGMTGPPPEPARPPPPEQQQYEQPYTAHVPPEPTLGYRPEPTFNGWQPPSQVPVAGHPPRQQEREARDAIELPHPIRDYRTGRLLARLMTWLGGFQLLIGLAILPVAVLSPRMLAGLPVLAAPLMISSIMAAGFVQMIFGQLVRALLDQANASRDLAAIARAQAAPPAPAEHEPKPRGHSRNRRK